MSDRPNWCQSCRIAELVSGYQYCGACCHQQLADREERIAALEAERDRLRQWARHGETCAAGWDDQAGCTCGLAETVDHV